MCCWFYSLNKIKKLLSLLGTITLIGISTTSLVACNHILKIEELIKLKEKNKINTTNQEIKNNLEWISQQEKPFNTVDNKYYYVVWRSGASSNWKIIKFLNDTNNKKELDSSGRYKLIFKQYSPFYDFTLLIRGERGDADHTWRDGDDTYFKFIYRWNLVDKPAPDLYIDNNGSVKVNR